MSSMKISNFNTLHSAKLFTFKYESSYQLGSKQNSTCLSINILYKYPTSWKMCDYMDSAYATSKHWAIR